MTKTLRSPALHEAARELDLEKVKHLTIHDGVDVTERDRLGRTAFYYASQAKHVMSTIQKAKDVMSTIQEAWEPNALFQLIDAIKVDCVVDDLKGILSTIRTHKVQVNEIDYEARTPLHRVLMETEIPFKLQIVEALIQVGADVNAKDTYENTPLFIVFKSDYGIDDLLNVLAQGGAKFSTEDVYFLFRRYEDREEKIRQLLLSSSTTIQDLNWICPGFFKNEQHPLLS